MSEIEFSRRVRVEPLPRDGLRQQIEATATECAALAKLNDLQGIERLKAHFHITKWGKGVRVEGELSAKVTQTCVVSLEPFEVEIDEPIEAKFLPPDTKAPAADSHIVDEADGPDPLIDGKIDLGALTSEFLTLALDPYPRKPGVAFEPPADAASGETPFSRLNVLSGRDEPD